MKLRTKYVKKQNNATMLHRTPSVWKGFQMHLLELVKVNMYDSDVQYDLHDICIK